jgi:hypothetical protein
MERTTISLPEDLARALRVLAAERRTSMAQLVREAAQEKVAEARRSARSHGIAEPGVSSRPIAEEYTRISEKPGIAPEYGRPTGFAEIVGSSRPEWVTSAIASRDEPLSNRVTIPDIILRAANDLAADIGLPLARLVQLAIEEKIVRMRPRPLIGIYSSGYTDTSERSTEGTFEPPPWRSS